MTDMDALNGKHLVILGIARQGMALVRFAVEAGALVTLSDLRPAEALRDALDSLADLPAARLRVVLGQHPPALLDGGEGFPPADALALSGGVPADAPIAVEALRRGIPLTNDSLEFARRAPAPIVGITGSAGKTTTTALVGLMGQRSGRTTWIGGNIGRPLIADLERMSPGDLIVTELSSFQLELWPGVPATPSPAVAAILNITPNHLDRHKTMDRYAEAKGNILRYQSAGDVVVLPADNDGTLAAHALVCGRLRLFSRHRPVDDGAYAHDGQIWLCDPASGPRALCPVGDIRLRGGHNVLNVLAAAALAEAAGVPDEAIVEGIRSFSGVPHRLEIIRTVDGVQFVNDSIATAPERALAALAAFDEPIILLAGGRDKNMVWDEWARRVAERVKRVVLFGDLGEPLAERLGQSVPLSRVDTLAEAVYVAQAEATAGDVVLLSPGGTSFDSYADFTERGEHFRLLVEEL